MPRHNHICRNIFFGGVGGKEHEGSKPEGNLRLLIVLKRQTGKVCLLIPSQRDKHVKGVNDIKGNFFCLPNLRMDTLNIEF